MKDNRLIAQFLGFQKTDIGWYDFDEVILNVDFTILYSNTYDEHELAFHSSWDWLMPVIRKILDISFNDDRGAEDFNCIIDCIPDIDHTYNGVVRFVKEYTMQGLLEGDVKHGIQS